VALPCIRLPVRRHASYSAQGYLSIRRMGSRRLRPMDPDECGRIAEVPVCVLPAGRWTVMKPTRRAMPGHRHDQMIQVTTAAGERCRFRGVVEGIRERSNGAGLMGYFHFQQSQWRVHRLACGEWMGVDQEGRRINISHWLIDVELADKAAALAGKETGGDNDE